MKKKVGEGQENVTTLEMMSAPVHKDYRLLHPEAALCVGSGPKQGDNRSES